MFGWFSGNTNEADYKVSIEAQCLSELGDFECLEEYVVTEKFGWKLTERCYEPAGWNPESWDDESSTGQRVNHDKVNGW